MAGGNRTLLSMAQHHRCSEALCFYATHVLWRREVVGGWVAPIGDKMKLTCVTATFNSIKAGNRERLIRCVESVAKLKTEHEHLIYDGASNDGTAELLRELEAKIPGLKVVSEPDTGIYNALNKGVRDAKGEWFYVLGCDDYVANPAVMDDMLDSSAPDVQVIVTTVSEEAEDGRIVSHKFTEMKAFGRLFRGCVCSHQGEIIKTQLVRKLGGFDERYRISADTNMFLLAHLRGLKFQYIFDEFAVFHLGGTADSNAQVYKREDQLCVERALGLSARQSKFYERTDILPLIVLIKLLFHRDKAVKIGAYYMLKSWVKMRLCQFGIMKG